MATEYSKPFECRINGVLMAEVQKVDRETSSEDKAVKTMLKGMSGHSDGAHMAKVSLTAALPKAGYEVDFEGYCERHETVTMAVKGAKLERTYKGRFLSAKSSSSVDNPNAVDAEFEGALVSVVRL